MTARLNLRNLATSSEFSFLQSKLDRLNDSYNLNSNESNVNKCCEIIEQNARLQRELFKLLHEIAADGGLYSNARSLIRSRFYPYFYEDYYLSSARASALLSASKTLQNDLVVYETLARKNAEIEHLTFEYEKNLDNLEHELHLTKGDLDYTKSELYAEKRKATDDKISQENEISSLRAQIKCLELEVVQYRGRASLVDDCERQIQLLKDDIRILRNSNTILADNNDLAASILIKSRSASPARSRSCSPIRARSRSRATTPSRQQSQRQQRATSPLARNNSTQLIREENLTSRFNEMYTKDRLDAMDILRVYSDDYENNQRIVYAAVQEAYAVAKKAFVNWKLKVRSTVACDYKAGSEGTLEEAVQDYISRNIDLYDLPAMVADVISSLNRNIRLYLPPGVSYSIISSFIREACRLAWQMNCLAYPLDVSFSIDGEIIDEHKYRRSYDSEFSAPLVHHHIWPCLMQSTRIVSKGEVCTRRVGSARSLASSPVRGILRIRSPSPIRRTRFYY